MGNAREPDIIEDPIATATAHVIDVYVYSDAKMRTADLVDISAKTLTLIIEDLGAVQTKSYTAATIALGHGRFTLDAAHFVTPGAFTAQFFIDGLLVNEYQGEFVTKFVGT